MNRSSRVCEVTDCDGLYPYEAKGLCHKHYKAQWNRLNKEKTAQYNREYRQGKRIREVQAEDFQPKRELSLEGKIMRNRVVFLRAIQGVKPLMPRGADLDAVLLESDYLD